MTEDRKSEYNKHNLQDQPITFYTEKFREADPAEISSRIHIPYDPEKKIFSVRFLGTDYQVSWPDFQITPKLADNSGRVLILRYLLFAEYEPFSNHFISFRDMPSGDLYFTPFRGRCILRFNRKYGSRIETFRQVLEEMGCKKVNYADACYDVELFPELYIRFILWTGDDEFPASSQILFSDNFKKAFQTYDLAEAGGVCLNAFAAREAKHA
ncbi:MAG: DUF3786 domain-containing protein [Bilifractor sp.]